MMSKGVQCLKENAVYSYVQPQLKRDTRAKRKNQILRVRVFARVI